MFTKVFTPCDDLELNIVEMILFSRKLDYYSSLELTLVVLNTSPRLGIHRFSNSF